MTFKELMAFDLKQITGPQDQDQSNRIKVQTKDQVKVLKREKPSDPETQEILISDLEKGLNETSIKPFKKHRGLKPIKSDCGPEPIKSGPSSNLRPRAKSMFRAKK